MKLARSKTVAEALKAARVAPPVTVTPWIEAGPNGNTLRIRDDAGYEQTSASLRDEM
jgi:hypothetical protein